MKRNRKYLIESFEEEWTCPITSMPMIEPVSTIDGHSYEKTSILDWLKKKKTSPKTGLDLSSENLIPNIVLRNVINKFENQFKYQFDKLCTQNTELSDKIDQFQTRIKELNRDKIKTQNQYHQIKSKYSELLGNSKKVGESFVQLKKEVQIIKTQNQELKREKATLKVDIKSIDSLKKQNKLLREESETLKKDNQFLLAQSQSLIQQRIESTNAATFTKNELTAAKKSNEQLKTLLTKQMSQYNALLGKADECKKLQLANQEILMKYNITLEKLKNKTELLQNSNENKYFSTADHIKDNEIQKLKLQSNRYRIENANLKTEIKSAVAELDKLKLDHQRLVNIHSFCIFKIQEQQLKKAPPKEEILVPKKLEKIVEEKQLKPDILDFINVKKNQEAKKTQKPSEKKQYVPAKAWKAPDSKDNQKPSAIDKVLKLFQNQPVANEIPSIKPFPLQKPSSSPELQSLRDLIRDPFSEKMHKIQQQNKKIKHILPFKDYLLSNPVLYDQQKKQLDHTGCRIDMEEFLKHNWSELKTLNLSESDLDDRGFEMLTAEAIFFTNLNNLWLWNNFVVNVSKAALDRFKNLRTVYFCIKGRHANPLNEQSKKYLNEFTKRNPLIQVAYDNKPQ